MTKLILNAGVCGMKSEISVDTNDNGTVSIKLESDCPHLPDAVAALPQEIDPYSICFKQGGAPFEALLDPHIPHRTCPCACAILKGVEAEAQLALKRNVSIEFVD